MKQHQPGFPRRFSKQNQHPNARPSRAFTLIELLVVIAVIAILAALVFPVLGAVNSAKIRSRTQAELSQIETAIETYKAKLGHYPPDNPGKPALHQLYYELLGTTNDGVRFITLDGNITTAIPVPGVQAAFGPSVGGFVNSISGGGGGDEVSRAQNCFPGGVRPNQVARVPSGATILVGVTWQKGPSPFDFDPIPGAPGVNPWRYVSSNPTNNPSSFDLWIEVRIGSKTYLVSNWSKKPVPISTHDPY